MGRHLLHREKFYGHAKSRGAGGLAEKDLGRYRFKMDSRRPKLNTTSFSLATIVTLILLMIRNPKDFEVWSACPSGSYSVITGWEILPLIGWRGPPKNEMTRPAAIEAKTPTPKAHRNVPVRSVNIPASNGFTIAPIP